MQKTNIATAIESATGQLLSRVGMLRGFVRAS